ALILLVRQLTEVAFAVRSHFTHTIGWFVQVAKARELVTQSNEVSHTHGVHVTASTATERRETNTKDQTHIGFVRGINDAFFQTAGNLDAHRNHAAGNNFFGVVLFTLGHNRSDQVVSSLVNHFLRLAFLVGFVLVETNAVLLTIAFVFVHHFHGRLEVSLHTIREAFGHYFVSMNAGVDTHYVEQVSRAHREAEFFHYFVNGLEVSTVAQQTSETSKVWEQYAVNQETRAVVDHDRGFAHGSGVSNHSGNGFFGGFLTTDHFHQRHHVYRVEEVHTE